MKLSINWLNQYIDHNLTPEELSHKLTMAGLEVESVSQFGTDTVFEIEVTPNRPDALNMLGLAREVSAITDKDLKQPAVGEYEDVGNFDVSIEDKDACSRYIATVIENVSVKPFPSDKSIFLQAFGAKPISNIVDITNFVLFEFGQPLHAFDLDKLEGGKIIVRRAKKGEKIITLDDVERTLDESILVIADARKPVAIAGIMGGRDTGVTASTKRIVLESAHFDLGVIRRASRKLALTSDACYRFERGVAWKTIEIGSNRATDLILELAGGSVAARKDLVAKELSRARHEVVVSMADIQKLLGAPLELARCEKILKRLGCIVAAGANTLTVVPPHFRNDIKIKEDLIEELARMVGFDNLPMSLPQVSANNISVNQDKENFNRRVAELFIAEGANEIVTYAMVSAPALDRVNFEGEKPIRMQNPMSAEQELMRPTGLANVLAVAASNFNRGARDLKLFEVGKRYLRTGERWTLDVLFSGKKDSDWRRTKKDLVDFYDIKGDVEEVFSRLRVRSLSFEAAAHKAYEPGQCARVLVGGQEAGFIGKISDEVLARFEIKKTAVFFAEIDLEILSGAVAPREKFMELDGFPVIVRDLSLAVNPAAVTFEQMKAMAFDNSKGLLKKIDFVELYTGEKVEKGCKGYVFSLTYQSKERTLTDEEVNALNEEIAAKFIEKFGVKRR
ncbi:MAG: phenylalanine--tRNA ligase subunit beta [Candidatus Omnitrophica bacterium]|nr:phenylalanine--tRNA ligase subunit beta [Candidatus Omnitrophota bacterium]